MHRIRFQTSHQTAARRWQEAVAATAPESRLEKFAIRFAEASLLGGVICIIGVALRMTIVGGLH